MKKLFLLLSLMVHFAFITRATDTLTVSSNIKEVTVFFEGAQIQHEVELNLKKGATILQITGLPHDLITKSLQVHGITDCKILSVKTSISPLLDKQKQEEIKQYEAKIKEHTTEIKKLKGIIGVYQREEKILLDNSKLGTSHSGIKVAELKEAADFFRFRLNEIKSKIYKIEADIEKIIEETYHLYGKMNRLEALKEQLETRLFINLDAERQIKNKLVFTYYIAKAGWRPSYDFRVNDVNEPLILVYQANIIQTSGQDWKNVKIKLSASNPSLGSHKPELPVWYAHRPLPRTESVSTPFYAVDHKNTDGTAGSIRGKIMDAQTNEPIPFANIIIESSGRQVSGSSSDFDGNYRINPVPAGRYLLRANSVGYRPQSINNLIVSQGQITFQNFSMQPTAEMLAEVMVTEYAVPLISRDHTSSGGTMTSEEIRRMPGRSASGTSSGGVFSSDGGLGQVRGARSEGTITYIDGVRVRGSSGLADSRPINLTGGSAAQYGDIQKGVQTNNLIDNILKNQIANIEYHIETPYTILSDGEEYMLKIKEAKIPVEYVYHIVPKKDRDAFLIANITDWIPLNLIDGKTSVYFQGTFVGESYLNTQTITDTLSLSLGRDKAIFVERKHKTDIADRITWGNNIRENIGWDITVRNNKRYPVKIVIEENYPLSELRSVNIDLTETSGGKVDDTSGKVTWEFVLGESETKHIPFQYVIRYPRNQRIYFD